MLIVWKKTLTVHKEDVAANSETDATVLRKSQTFSGIIVRKTSKSSNKRRKRERGGREEREKVGDEGVRKKKIKKNKKKKNRSTR